eukprot:m.414577 g.414577  ORF g.414577 m.414577 type:complete len:707 (+) comp21272_c0_seq1:256-2376(+)
MGDSKEISLSVDETNTLRASLGLKPLKIDDKDKNEITSSVPGQSKMDNDVLVAPVVPGDKKQTAELREKLEAKRQKRQIEKKLKEVKTLAEDADDDDSAAAWIKKSRALAKQKKLAAKKAAELNAMDNEVEADATSYDASNLSGLTVVHDKADFEEGRDTILTLADAGVLDDTDDVLENANILENDRHKKNVEARNKGLDEYKGYDDDEFDGTKPKAMLSKYDNIDVYTGDEKKSKKEGFTLDSSGGATLQREREAAAIREKLKKPEFNLDFEVKKDGTDFYTSTEMAQFKKRKKKVKKVRKTKALTADDLEATAIDDSADADRGSRKRRRGDSADASDAKSGAAAVVEAMATGTAIAKASVTGAAIKQATAADTAPAATTKMEVDFSADDDNGDDDVMTMDLNDVPVDEAELQAEAEMQTALVRAMKVKKAKQAAKARKEQLARAKKETKPAADDDDADEAGGGEGLVFTSMAEFVRHVGGDESEDEETSNAATATALADKIAAAGGSVVESAPADTTSEAVDGDVPMDVDRSGGWAAPVADDAQPEDTAAAAEDTARLIDDSQLGRGLMASVQFSKLRGFFEDDTKQALINPGLYKHPDRMMGEKDDRKRMTGENSVAERMLLCETATSSRLTALHLLCCLTLDGCRCVKAFPEHNLGHRDRVHWCISFECVYGITTDGACVLKVPRETATEQRSSADFLCSIG